MKYLSMFLLLISTCVMAGDYYYESRIDTYDPVTGLYYKAVEEVSTDKGFLSSKSSQNNVININIFNPIDGTSTLLFKTAQKNGIPIVLFETGFKDGVIEFNGTANNRTIALNNFRIYKREPKNKLLVGLRNADLKETILYISDKKGSGLKKLVTVPNAADWHIDVKNSKLRVVHQTGKEIRIESYEW